MASCAHTQSFLHWDKPLKRNQPSLNTFLIRSKESSSTAHNIMKKKFLLDMTCDFVWHWCQKKLMMMMRVLLYDEEDDEDDDDEGEGAAWWWQVVTQGSLNVAHATPPRCHSSSLLSRNQWREPSSSRGHKVLQGHTSCHPCFAITKELEVEKWYSWKGVGASKRRKAITIYEKKLNQPRCVSILETRKS